MVVPTVWVLAAPGEIKLETGETHRSPWLTHHCRLRRVGHAGE